MENGQAVAVNDNSWKLRKHWWLPLVGVLCLMQTVVIFTIGGRGMGPLWINVVDLALNLLSVAVCIQAAQRSNGLARYFWRAAAVCFSIFGISLTFGASALLAPTHPGLTEISDVISVFWMAPLSLALFLEADFSPSRFDPIHLLDFGQILLFWVAIYILFLFLPTHEATVAHHGWLQQTWAGSLVYDLSMTLLFSVRAMLASTKNMRRLFTQFAVFLAVGCVADFYANYYRAEIGLHFEFVWLTLNAVPVILAGTWREAPEETLVSQRMRGVSGDRVFPVLTGLLVLVLSMVIVRDRLGFALGMVCLSFGFTSARMLVLQSRERRVSGDLEAEIAERRRAEQLLRENEEHLEEQVALRTRELSAANAQLRSEIEGRQRLEEQLRHTQKMEAIGTLSGGIAHDFNNLLTVIRGYASMLMDRVKQDPELRADVEQIDEAGARAASLTGQLLAFSRRQMQQPRVLHVDSLLRDLHKMLQRLIGEDVQLVMRLEAKSGTVEADPGQLEQVVMNLVVNARDAMPRGGTLTIESADVHLSGDGPVDLLPGDYVMFSVGDTGCGISDELMVHIFEPFFTTKERTRGTGLGLSTVYGIVKQSGGSIDVSSVVGRGSTFKIYLPRVNVRDQKPLGEHRAAATQGTETVLLVEDDAQVRTLAQSILTRCGYKVFVAENGTQAVEFCQHHTGILNLMLTDVVMPGLSGREVAERVTPGRPEMKVLYMSGYTDDAIVHHGVLEAGITLLQKPFTPQSLAAKVREVLDSRIPQTSFKA